MTAPVIVDIEAYRNRAANAPQPATHAQAVARLTPEALNIHDPEMALQLATTQANYFADWSEYQPVVTSAYAYPISMHRFFSGYRTDANAAANWLVIDNAINAGRIRVAFTYPVFVPGQFTAMMTSLRNQFGAQSPTNRLVPVLDMESGGAFAGPGNHSPEANDWAAALAEYAGTPDYARSHGYANVPDFQECWPQIVPLIPKHTAAYTSVNPGSFAWQYQGGNPTYPAPAGAPRSYAPFGTYIDGNVIYQSLDQIEQILGITLPPLPIPKDDPMWQDATIWNIGDGPAAGQAWLLLPDGRYFGIQNTTELAAFKALGAVTPPGNNAGQNLTGAGHRQFLAASPNYPYNNQSDPTAPMPPH